MAAREMPPRRQCGASIASDYLPLGWSSCGLLVVAAADLSFDFSVPVDTTIDRRGQNLFPVILCFRSLRRDDYLLTRQQGLVLDDNLWTRHVFSLLVSRD